MSKFVDRLNEAQQTAVPSMGFGRKRPVSPNPKILLVAYLASPVAGDLANVVAGADAGLLNITDSGKGKKTLEECAAAVPGIPWGGWLSGAKRGSPKSKTPGDYLVFVAADTPLGFPEGGEAGKILEVPVKTGDKVEEGDIICTLESMKMENPILAPVSGVINEIRVSPEQAVKSGDIIAIIEY